jgi:hypothetical protein
VQKSSGATLLKLRCRQVRRERAGRGRVRREHQLDAQVVERDIGGSAEMRDGGEEREPNVPDLVDDGQQRRGRVRDRTFQAGENDVSVMCKQRITAMMLDFRLEPGGAVARNFRPVKAMPAISGGRSQNVRG